MKTNMRRQLSTNRHASSHSHKAVMMLRALALCALLFSSGLVQKSAAQELKLMTWNVCGVHCAGAGHLYDIEQFNRVITDSKVNPDALSLQEVTLDEALSVAYAMGFRNRTDILAHLQFVTCRQFNRNLDPHYLSYYLARYGLRASDFGGDGSTLGGYPADFGNAIITARRFPIKDRGRWTPASQDPAYAPPERNRLAVASIEISAKQFINLCSMHTPNAVSQAVYARNQANEIRQIAKSTYGNYRYVLLGDFNMQRPRTAEGLKDMSHAYNVLRGGFNDAWYEWQQKNPGMQDYLGLTFSTANPVIRYDYIFLDNRRPTDVLYARVLNPNNLPQNEYSFDFFTALYRMGSDHYPVFARVNFR